MHAILRNSVEYLLDEGGLSRLWRQMAQDAVLRMRAILAA